MNDQHLPFLCLYSLLALLNLHLCGEKRNKLFCMVSVFTEKNIYNYANFYVVEYFV